LAIRTGRDYITHEYSRQDETRETQKSKPHHQTTHTAIRSTPDPLFRERRVRDLMV
jgi:hypothetical protein